MPAIFKISSDIATPLALAGLFAAILFFTFRQLLSARLFPKLASVAAGEIIKRIVDYLFILSLAAMVLGFAAFLWRPGSDPIRPNVDTNKPTVGGVILGEVSPTNGPTSSTSNKPAGQPTNTQNQATSPSGGPSSPVERDQDRTQGSIKVVIEPAEATEQGAQWKMAHETAWRRSGENFETLSNGTYRVEFMAVVGWLAPSNRTVRILAPNTNGLVQAAYKRFEDDKPCRDRTEVLRLTFIGNCTWETGYRDFGDCQVTRVSVKGVGRKPSSSSITLERLGQSSSSNPRRSPSGINGNWTLDSNGLNCSGLGCASGNYQVKISDDRCGETSPTVLEIQLK